MHLTCTRPRDKEQAHGKSSFVSYWFSGRQGVCSACASAAQWSRADPEQEARSARIDARGEFLLGEADAIAHTDGGGARKWRGAEVYDCVVRPRLHQTHAP